MDSDYNDIIDLPHPTSERHHRMPKESRAAQFAPFSALCGFEDAILDEARITEKEFIPSEDITDRLNELCNLLKDIVDSQPKISVRYFIPDKKKSGGIYKSIEGRITEFNQYDKTITLDKSKKIPIILIKEMCSELFGEMLELM